MITLTPQQKEELIDYVLTRVPVWLFNTAVKGFSTQTLYRRFKRDLLTDYAHIMTGELDYAIIMAEAFSAYNVDQVAAPRLRFQIDTLKAEIKMLKKLNAVQYYAKVDEHNQLVEQYSALIIPQNKLIARYKKTHNIK
jgi:hypothetical protein